LRAAIRARGRQAGLGAITVVLAAACGLAVANIYYAQPLLGLLAHSFGTSDGAVTVVVTVTQIGYALSLFLLLPLGDLFENRKLTSVMLLVTAAALALAGSAPWLGVFLVASVIIGVTSVVAQILLPFAAHLTPEASRGQVMGRLNMGRRHPVRRLCRVPCLLVLGVEQLAGGFQPVAAGAAGRPLTPGVQPPLK
jgi:predicted MFS family arabinose efflux permease